MKNRAMVLLLLAGLFFSRVAFAEIILLKSGKTVEGRVTERTNKYIRIDFHGVQLTFFLDEVERINGARVNVISKERQDHNSVASLEFLMAGVPKPIGEKRDYDAIFSMLKASGVDAVCMTFLYKESPPRSLGYEPDFLPPCDPNKQPWKALKKYKIKLLVPGEIAYPVSEPLPALENDPLKQLIACLGREGIIGVYSYDEPTFRDLLEPCRRLYERVKTVDPGIPVMIIHGPLFAGAIGEGNNPPSITQAQIDGHLAKFKEYSKYADIVGFDFYPIPKNIANLTSPFADRNVVDYRQAIRDYLSWLRKEVPFKKYILALQGFSYTDIFEGNVVEEARMAGARYPTREELQEMFLLSKEEGASYVIFWGQTCLDVSGLTFWDELLNAIKEERNGGVFP